MGYSTVEILYAMALRSRATCFKFGLFPNPGHAGWWCPRQESNLRPQDSYHFGFRRHPKGVRGLDCPFAMGSGEPLGTARPVSTPSRQAGLGSGSAGQIGLSFPRL